MKKTCAVVVTYNRLELLKECINSLLNQGDNLGHIVVVNNVSTDGTREYLDDISDNDKIIVEHSEKNLGGAGGFSRGIKIAYKKTNDDYFWILDDDTIPTKSTLKELYAGANVLNQQFGFLCSNVSLIDGTTVNVPTLSTNWTDKIDDSLIKVDRATFVSVLIKRETVSNLGLPISEMFIWGDDSEYTTRLSLSAPSYYVLNSKVIHKTTYNIPGISIINVSSDKIERYFYSFRNQLYIDRKYKNSKKVFNEVIFNIKVLIKVLFEAKNNKLKRILIIIRGTMAGLKFNPEVKSV